MKWLDYGELKTIHLYRQLGLLHLGCNREVAAQVSLVCMHVK